MADKGIKGITIEIGGNTQLLEKALKAVNTQSIGLQGELKTVQRLLKLDSGNVTLMAQKQELLAKAIESAKEKLEALKNVQGQVTQQFQNGQIGEQQYRAFQRELANTEISLHSLEGRLASTNNALSGNVSAEMQAAQAAAENARRQEELNRTVDTATSQLSQEQAELARNTAALTQNASGQDRLRLTRESLIRQIDLQERAVEGLRTQVEELSRTEGTSEHAIAEQRAELARAETALLGYRRELQNTEREMSDLNRAAAGFTTFGNSATKAGQAIMPISLAVAGLGVAAVKTGSDFDAAMGQVAATMGMTAEQVRNGCEDYEKLRQAAKDAGESTKFTAAQAGEALNFLALAGYDANKAIGALPTVLNLAAAGGLELGYASDLVTDSMSALGIKTNELVNFSDQLAKTSQKSNTNIAQLGEAIITVGGTAKNLKGGTVELNTALGILADNGIKGSDSGTALRQVILNLSAPTEKAAKFMEEFGISAFDAEGNMKPLNETFLELDAKLAGLNDEDRMRALSNIFDSRQLKSAEALLANCGDRFTTLSGQIANADDAAANMAETMGENLQGQLTLLASQIQGVAIELTEILMPTIRNIVEKISEWVEKFSELDESSQKTILAVAGIVAAAGPLLILIGKIGTGIGAILSLASATSVGIGGVSTALAALTGPVGIAVMSIAGLTVAGISLYRAVNESVIPTIDLFADKVTTASDGTKTLEQAISDSTEAAVGSYMDLERGAGESLAGMSSIVSANTDEQLALLANYSSTVQQKYSEMKDMVIAKMEERQTEEMQLLQQNFAESSALSEEKEAEILQQLNDKQYEEKSAVAKQYEEINAIVANAKAQERGLTLDEMQQIKAIQEEQKANAVKVLSDTEMEAMVILERMKGYNGTVSTEIASKTIQDAEAARLAVVAEAEQKCSEEIALAIHMKDELGIISQEEYDKLIADAQRKKTDTVAEAEAMKTATVDAMLAQNAELAEVVDTSTGEILSKWDVFKNSIAAKWEEISQGISETTQQIKENAVREFTELGDDICNKLEAAKNFFKGIWDQISQVFSNAGKNIKNNAVKTFTDLKTSISNKFTEIKVAISTKIEEIKTAITTKFTEIVTAAQKLPEEIKQVGIDMIKGLIAGFTEKFEDALAKVSEICTSIVDTAKSIFDERSPSKVFHEIGAYVSEGLAEGIEDGGESAVGQMEALAGKILSTGDALSTGIISKDSETGELIYDNLYTNTMKKLDLYYQDRDKRISLVEEGTEENIKSMGREVKETEKASNLKIKLYQQEYKAKVQLLSDEADEATKALQEELDAIDDAEEQKQRKSEDEEYNLKMQELYNKLHVADEKDKDGILADIQKTEAARKKVLDKQSINDEKAAIRERLAVVKEEAEEKKKALQEELEAKEYQLEQQRTTEINHMNAIISLMEKQADKRKELEKLETDIAKNEEQQRTDSLAREKEKQSDKAKTELDKQTEALKESKRQEAIEMGEGLNSQKIALEKSIADGDIYLKQKVSNAVTAEREITEAVITETQKRNQAQGQGLFPAANQQGGHELFSEPINKEEKETLVEQTEFLKKQWDSQTEYRQTKEQEQTGTFGKQLKAQSEYFLQQQKERSAAFNAALTAAVAAFRNAAQNIQSIAYTCGQQIYQGIASTEGDINSYIDRMVEKIKDSLERASQSAGGYFSGGDYDGSHRNGLNYVPFDNYRAILHKGEAVLTANENQHYNSQQTIVKEAPNLTINQHIYSPVADERQLRRETKRQWRKVNLEVN